VQTDLFGAASAQPTDGSSIAPLALPQPLPTQVYLGTSSWSFPGWVGLVYDKGNETTLAREGLAQYSGHPLLNAVGIDRGFYAPLNTEQYARYAAQVPHDFRFLIKAPSLITDAQVRDEGGKGQTLNPSFLDATLAVDQFIMPCIEGLGSKAGALVFQLSPLPRAWLADTATMVARLSGFFAALPALAPPAFYALEIRDATLLTPRFMHMLAARSIRYCLGVHASMPPVERQANAIALLPPGPLVVRWSLRAGLKYQQARDRYFPFNRLAEPDIATRNALATLAAQHVCAGQQVMLIANNKAEGSAPLTLLEFARTLQQALEKNV
jgi:uncharacterized protein YecE (DUF72 family)